MLRGGLALVLSAIGLTFLSKTPLLSAAGQVPTNIFTRMRYRGKRELIGNEEEQAVGRAKQSADVKNVVKDINGMVPAKSGDFMAVLHTVEIEGRELELLAVGFLSDDNQRVAVAYYELSEPVDRFLSGAFGYRELDDRALLVAASVNGKGATGTVAAGLGSHCGGCVDAWFGPWDYEYPICLQTDTGCYNRCVTACSAVCCSLCPPYCIVCVLTCEPGCFQTCCIQWRHICTSCGYF